jgi:hypothetical protein
MKPGTITARSLPPTATDADYDFEAEGIE